MGSKIPSPARDVGKANKASSASVTPAPSIAGKNCFLIFFIEWCKSICTVWYNSLEEVPFTLQRLRQRCKCCLGSLDSSLGQFIHTVYPNINLFSDKMVSFTNHTSKKAMSSNDFHSHILNGTLLSISIYLDATTTTLLVGSGK